MGFRLHEILSRGFRTFVAMVHQRGGSVIRSCGTVDLHVTDLTPRYARDHHLPVPVLDDPKDFKRLRTQDLLARIIFDLLNAVLLDDFDDHSLEVNR